MIVLLSHRETAASRLDSRHGHDITCVSQNFPLLPSPDRLKRLQPLRDSSRLAWPACLTSRFPFKVYKKKAFSQVYKFKI